MARLRGRAGPMDQIDVQTYKLHSEVYASHTIHRADRTERWTRVKKVGRGGFGRVYLERDMVGRFRAVKELSKEFNEAQRQDYLRELFAMAYFSKDQACFPYFRGWYEDRENIYIAMEYFELGDLLNCVPKPLSEAETRKIAFQLTEALAVLHSKNITHRDLKPEVRIRSASLCHAWLTDAKSPECVCLPQRPGLAGETGRLWYLQACTR